VRHWFDAYRSDVISGPKLGQSELRTLITDIGLSQPGAGGADETWYGAVLDTMDFIAGWCGPSRALYPGPE